MYNFNKIMKTTTGEREPAFKHHQVNSHAYDLGGGNIFITNIYP